MQQSQLGGHQEQISEDELVQTLYHCRGTAAMQGRHTKECSAAAAAAAALGMRRPLVLGMLLRAELGAEADVEA